MDSYSIIMGGFELLYYKKGKIFAEYTFPELNLMFEVDTTKRDHEIIFVHNCTEEDANELYEAIMVAEARQDI